MYVRVMAAAAALLAGASSAHAVTFNFSSPLTLSSTEAPGVWYTDRTAPLVFQTSGDKLVEQAGPQSNGAFYNTEGRAYDVPAGTKAMDIDLFVDPAFASDTNQRLAGFWGVGLDGGDNISSYPIIELDNVGGALDFRGYNSNTGAWTTLASNVSAGWDQLGIALVGDQINYYIDGVNVGGMNSTDSLGTVGFKSAILQTYNTPGAANPSVVWAGVPEPATWAMLLLGVGAIGAAMRRRRQDETALGLA